MHSGQQQSRGVTAGGLDSAIHHARQVAGPALGQPCVAERHCAHLVGRGAALGGHGRGLHHRGQQEHLPWHHEVPHIPNIPYSCSITCAAHKALGVPCVHGETAGKQVSAVPGYGCSQLLPACSASAGLRQLPSTLACRLSLPCPCGASAAAHHAREQAGAGLHGRYFERLQRRYAPSARTGQAETFQPSQPSATEQTSAASFPIACINLLRCSMQVCPQPRPLSLHAAQVSGTADASVGEVCMICSLTKALGRQ